jgi:Ran GTPase-activating protein (RanGAP) involved in mRNA processing and transport
MSSPLALTTLGLGSNRIGPNGVGALVAAATLPHLTSLDLHYCAIDDQAAEVLAGTPFLARLTTLKLQSNEISPAGVIALTRGQRLAHLNLAYNSLTDDAILALAAAPSAIHLVSLDVTCNRGITDVGARALADSHHLANLADLNLSYSRLRAGGATALLHSPYLARLSRLDLGNTGLTAEDARALAASPRLAQLTSLNLAGNHHLGSAGIQALLHSPHLTSLTSLDLMGSPIDDDTAAALAGWPGLRNLVSLGLRGGRLTSTGARRLLASPHLDDIALLDLRNHKIDDRAAGALRERFGKRVRLEWNE